MSSVTLGGDVFEIQQGFVDVTSLSRPDPAWRFVDAQGHEHRWYAGEVPATVCGPSQQYDVPSAIKIIDVEGTDYYFEESHLECRQCGELVEPEYTADTDTCYAPDDVCLINGRPVPMDEFERRYDERMRSLQA